MSIAVGAPAHRAPTMIASYILRPLSIRRVIPRSSSVQRRRPARLRRNYPARRFTEWVVSARSGESEELVIVGVGRGPRARSHVELGQNIGDMPVDRPLAQRQFLRDLLVRPAGRDKSQHV